MIFAGTPATTQLPSSKALATNEQAPTTDSRCSTVPLSICTSRPIQTRSAMRTSRDGLIRAPLSTGLSIRFDVRFSARRSLAEAQTRQYLAAMRALGCGKQEIHNLFDQMEEQEHADL